jgi:hypothetical protein
VLTLGMAARVIHIAGTAAGILHESASHGGRSRG